MYEHEEQPVSLTPNQTLPGRRSILSGVELVGENWKSSGFPVLRGRWTMHLMAEHAKLLFVCFVQKGASSSSSARGTLQSSKLSESELFVTPSTKPPLSRQR